MELSDWFKIGIELAGTAFLVGGAAAGTVTTVRIQLAVLSARIEMREKATMEALAKLEKKVDPVAQDLGEMKTKVALTDQRLLMLEGKVGELSHGEGYTLPLYRSPYEKGKS